MQFYPESVGLQLFLKKIFYRWISLGLSYVYNVGIQNQIRNVVTYSLKPVFIYRMDLHIIKYAKKFHIMSNILLKCLKIHHGLMSYLYM